MERFRYIDYLRVLATFATMILHIASQNFGIVDVNGYDWQVFNFYDSIVRWSVPVFVMISGVLFLNRDIPIKKIYSKNILRMISAFYAWNLIYSLFYNGTNIERIQYFITGHVHLWFIPMIIAVYMCVPFIRLLINEGGVKYYLLLSFIIAYFIPTIYTLTIDFGSEIVKGIMWAVNDVTNKMNFNFVLGYISYFVLGYYLHNREFTKKQRRIIYILGAIGFLSTIILNSLSSINAQQGLGNYYSNFGINVLLESVAVFIFFKHINFNSGKIYIVITKLSKYSFGAYLIHMLIINQLFIYGLDTLSFNVVLSVPCIGFGVFLISFTISAILNNIPVLKKYIV